MLKNIYSVGQISEYIANMFAQDFMLKNISIKGEISNCTYHSTGHIYFTLKDAKGVLKGVMFSGNRRNLQFHMKEGDQVVVTGSIESYKFSSQYQIIARSIELDGTGNLYQKLEELKKELEELGMFDEMYKRPIPAYARKIGVVTSPTGAVIEDIRNVGFRRNPYVQIILCPAQVQGDGAKESIVSGIQRLEQLGVDVIIVGRGGGSIEDLWAFNERIVADAIFNCSVPVISAVGHQTDYTIADMVADKRAATPSQAAEFAVFEFEQTKIALAQMKQRLNLSFNRKINMMRERLEHKATKLHFLSPKRRLEENRRRLMDFEEKMTTKMQYILQDKKNRLAILARTLDGYSPAKKISSGYAYLEGKDGKSIKTIGQVQVSDEITVHVIDGNIKAIVTEATKNE
ncbi:MAG: exodeoxyribonuclease VII large subunit [Agathobacter sp.]|nr:exodeoxyribonuclease VII large subunit [Agathobacter sp.]